MRKLFGKMETTEQCERGERVDGRERKRKMSRQWHVS